MKYKFIVIVVTILLILTSNMSRIESKNINLEDENWQDFSMAFCSNSFKGDVIESIYYDGPVDSFIYPSYFILELNITNLKAGILEINIVEYYIETDGEIEQIEDNDIIINTKGFHIFNFTANHIFFRLLVNDTSTKEEVVYSRLNGSYRIHNNFYNDSLAYKNFSLYNCNPTSIELYKIEKMHNLTTKLEIITMTNVSSVSLMYIENDSVHNSMEFHKIGSYEYTNKGKNVLLRFVGSVKLNGSLVTGRYKIIDNGVIASWPSLFFILLAVFTIAVKKNRK